MILISLLLTFIAPEDNPACFFCSLMSLPICSIPSRLSSSSMVLETTFDDGSKWFSLLEELVEELDGRSVDELLICVNDVEKGDDFISFPAAFDSSSLEANSWCPADMGWVDVVVASEDVERLGKYGEGLWRPTAAAACAAAAAAAWVCKSAAEACNEFCGDKNGDVLALRISCAWSCCKCAECTNAGLIAPKKYVKKIKKLSPICQ